MRNKPAIADQALRSSDSTSSKLSKHIIVPIDENWTFRQADKEHSKFLPVPKFPTNVHLGLIANDIIPDPFMGKNENDLQWIGEVSWVYRTTFLSPHLPLNDGRNTKAILAFDGLDTFATVILNGKEILKTENMFLPERVEVTKYLKQESQNELEITFESAYLKGCDLVQKHPHYRWICSNGDIGRLAVRKAQYHWGWDWGPTLMTCGPWRPINLEIYSSRIFDLYFRTDVDKSLKSAEIWVKADVEGNASKVKFEIFLGDKQVASSVIEASNGHAAHIFTIQDPALWYPIRYGKQPLYTLKASLQGSEMSEKSKRFGLRRVKLIQKPLNNQPGTSFFFEINNIRIFCGGSNWIPADSFIPRISKEKYYMWVKLAAEGNQFMIRVWGGGIYEEQAFYDACDELGILVWQDFMFACGNYPGYPEFLESVKREAEENVRLLRHHPCIVIYAGNNEDYQIREASNLTYDPEDKDPDNWLKTDFPARYIYEKILVDVCKEFVPDTYYHFGSPWGGKSTTDPTVGDIHQWNVWHGTQEKYQNFDTLIGRFVSEFGMHAFPNIKTIDAFLPKGKEDPDYYAQSSTLDFHNKALGHSRRLALYLAENIHYSPEPLEQYIYATQLMQAECLASAYRLWKRQWKGPGKDYCGGALVWQLNDCWPGTSWSIVDYFLRPKLAYYAVKREMEMFTLGIKRTMHFIPRDGFTRAFVRKETKIEVWGMNLGVESLRGDVVVKAFDVGTGEETFSKTIEAGMLFPGNRSTEITDLDVPVREKGADEEGRIVVAAYLFQQGVQIARYVNWPEPLKYVSLQKPKKLSVEMADDGKVVEISSEVPVKGVAVECEDEEVRFEDNLVDVVPGEVVRIGVKGACKDSKIGVRYFGMNVL